jgi:aspartate kinase
LLIGCAHKAQRHAWVQVEEDLAEIIHRHNHLIGALNFSSAEEKDLLSFLTGKITTLKNSLEVIHRTGSHTPEQLDAIAATGEQLSAPIFAALLRQVGISSISLDASAMIFTDSEFSHANVLFEATNPAIRRGVLPWLEQGCVPVITGFIGATITGQITTLGRGASDYTSTLVGAAVNALEVWNWTDVDGVLTADPRMAPQARIIPALSYSEMRLLSACGAKVLHPDTIKPVADMGIPLRVRNSFNPDGPGTIIQGNQPDRDHLPLAVASRSKLNLIHFKGGRLPRGLETSYQNALTAPTGDPLWVLEADPNLPLEPEAKKIANTSLISVIGGNTSTHSIHCVLEGQHIPVLAYSHKNSDGCSFAAVRNEDTAKAVQVLHDHLIIQAAQSFI